MTRNKSIAWLAAGGWLWLTLAGCASFNKDPQVPDIRPVRQKRAEEIAKRYEQHRDSAQYSAALASLNQGNQQGCRELLEKVLDRNPEHRESGLLMAELTLLNGDVNRARDQVEGVAVRYPEDAEVLHALGLVEAAAGNDATAAEYFEQALELDPTNEVFAASCVADDEPEPLTSRRRLQPPGPAIEVSAHLWKAEVWLALDGVDEAITLLEDVLEQEPSQAEAEHMAGRALERARLGPDAAAHYRRAAELDPDCKIYQVSAIAAAQKWPSARQRPAANPSEIATLTSASSVTTRAAAPSVQVFARDDDHNEPAGRASPFAAADGLRRGAAALTSGAPESALAYFQQARRAAPRDEDVAISGAVLLLRNEQPELAARLVQEALNDLPDSAGLNRIGGTAYYRLGQWKAAQVSLERSLSLDKSQPLSYFLMGSTLRKLGEPEAAETYFRQARQLDPRYAAERPSSSSR